MSTLFRYGGEKTVERLGRAVEVAFAQSAAVIQWGEGSRLLTGAETSSVLVPVLAVEDRAKLEKVAVRFDVAIGADVANYWTVVPYSFDETGSLRVLGAAVTTARRSLSALVPIVWDGLDTVLKAGHGVALKLTRTGSPTAALVRGTAKIRRGV